ncbi:MAG: hypothetical protein BWK73_25635 [Thiothrix lacustris]|uniref:Integrase n=1 Tax=Thiothrix lacustris TaxID=525917 RepID=A0A1Y1QL97_9GAMM|nr:MAG: hypothetical protein BWK73_25635 [Thiothrix lacustris]
MTRPRRIKTAYNIRYVHEANGRIVYRPHLTSAEKEVLPYDSGGFLRPPIALGRVGDPPDDIYAAYLKARESMRLQSVHRRNTLGWIVERYMDSREFCSLATKSQHMADTLKRILDHPLKINGADSTLAALQIRSLNQPLLHHIAEKRLSDYQERGRKGVVMVNRETTFLSTAISWAVNFVPDLGVTANPLTRFKKYKEEAVSRYVTDAEYHTQMEIAATIRAWLPPLFELTYLLATRGCETLDIRLSDLTEEGIRTRRTKGSRSNIILWSDRLRAAVAAARALHQKDKQTVRDPYLLCKRNGEAISTEGMNTYMQTLKQHMEANELGEVYWNLHLLTSSPP